MFLGGIWLLFQTFSPRLVYLQAGSAKVVPPFDTNILGGAKPPIPVPCPPGGSGGLGPPGISDNYPCLASAAAVPCPRALPPILFVQNFSCKFFRLSVRRPSSVRPSVRQADARPGLGLARPNTTFPNNSFKVSRILSAKLFFSRKSLWSKTFTAGISGEKFVFIVVVAMAVAASAKLRNV